MEGVDDGLTRRQRQCGVGSRGREGEGDEHPGMFYPKGGWEGRECRPMMLYNPERRDLDVIQARVVSHRNHHCISRALEVLIGTVHKVTKCITDNLGKHPHHT